MNLLRAFLIITGLVMMLIGLGGCVNAWYASQDVETITEAYGATVEPTSTFGPAPSDPNASGSTPTATLPPPTADIGSEPTATLPPPTVGTGSEPAATMPPAPTIVGVVGTPALQATPTTGYGYSYNNNFSSIGTHSVKSGENLYCIGRAYGVSPDAIAIFNGIRNNDRLYPGQTLSIPNMPWNSQSIGKTCLPQFQSPYIATPTFTPTPSATAPGENGSQGENNDNPTIDGENATHSGMAETRNIQVVVPINMTLGESVEVILTFNPEDPDGPSVSVTNTPQPTPTAAAERQVSAPDFRDISYFSNYNLFAVARLDAPGFAYSPAGDVRRIVRFGEELVYRWSIQPTEAENQTLIISLWLEYEPKHPDVEPLTEGLSWSNAYVVEVRGTLFGLTTATLASISAVVEAVGMIQVVLAAFSQRLSLFKNTWGNGERDTNG